jgi:hypothetical protein
MPVPADPPRRASDASGLGFAVVAVAVSIPVMPANSAVEPGIVHALNPPPLAIQWLVTATFWVAGGGAGRTGSGRRPRRHRR